MANKQHFQHVGQVRPPRSAFDMSHDHKSTINMGLIYPMTCIECYPGDKFTIFNEIVARFQPLIAPILHQVDLFTHTFFVPDRLLWGSVHSQVTYPTEPPRAWEQFITGGENNDFAVPLPRWRAQGSSMKKTLWDYFGYPMESNGVPPTSMQRDDFFPIDFPRRAYNFIWNEYYRDQKLQQPVAWDNIQILRRCWEKDYFTIARPSRQVGQAMAIPLSGAARVGFKYNDQIYPVSAITTQGSTGNVYALTSTPLLPGNLTNAPALMQANMADGVGTFDVSDLRQIVQLQKWQERNSRAGTRYREFVPAHFGVSIRDERLDRPEYIGGTKSPVIISEVLQTEGTTQTSPQANMAGHGITADTTKVGTYFVREHGIIMTLLSVRPRTAYMNQIHRSWLRRTRYDFYSPEFAHLSEQAVYKGEVAVVNANSNNWDPWGYQGIFDELRYIPSLFTGDMRNVMRYWHIGRIFNSTEFPAGMNLNASFVSCFPRTDMFAVQQAPDPNAGGSLVPVDNIIINYSARIKAVRPMPFLAEPGLVDHF